MSANGKRIAIAANNNAGTNGGSSGHVRVFQVDGTPRTQVGGDVDGKAAGDRSGWSMAMSANGNRLIIGAPFSTFGLGHARVFEFDEDYSTWVQVGGDIDGEAAFDQSGISVAMSANGNRVTITANFKDGDNAIYSGHARLFKLVVEGRVPSAGTSTWAQLGEDIDGEASFDFFGSSVAMAADGNLIAIGAPFNDGNGVSSGHVRFFKADVALIR